MNAPRRVDGFFYGLFMDQDVLKAAGVDAVNFRPGYVEGFQLRIGQRATLAAVENQRAYGVIIAMSHEDLDRLYSAEGLRDYKPEAVLATTLAGKEQAALCYNLVEPPRADEQNSEYARQLKQVLARYGFPPAYIDSIN